MDKRNVIIGLLILALGLTLFYTFNKGISFPSTATIPPSQELKSAFDQSFQDSAMANVAELSCFPTSRFDCDQESCTPAAPATYYFVDYGTKSGTYFRCDANGCDPYPVTVNPSGEFTQFMPSQGQAMLFKVATGEILGNKGEFVDITTTGRSSIVSFGKCTVR